MRLQNPRSSVNQSESGSLPTEQRHFGIQAFVMLLLMQTAKECERILGERMEAETQLFVAKGDQRIDAYGSAGRKKSREGSYAAEDDGDGRERERIIGRNAKQHVAQ